MSVIFSASTDVGSSQHTSRIIRPLMLFLFPGISEETLDLIHTCVRKCGHLSEFALLGILWWRALRSVASYGPSLGRQFAHAVCLSCLFACTDEFHQLFVPSREGCVRDVLIDTVGAAAGAAVFWAVLRWRSRK